ncbi:MAG: hypothetical protein N2712_07980 [Brevinematales bacterium]|nr:hypothetical protein [Brevinematales bacterium]
MLRKLEWYISLHDKFLDIDSSRCKFVEGYGAGKGRSHRIAVVDKVANENS